MAEDDRPVLESRALGSGLDRLVQPCGDSLRPAAPPPPRAGPTIGLTFSGGGFRATFAALGVARYLADCGLLGNVRFVSSVSGGSVANAMLATRWPQLRASHYSAAALDTDVIAPLADRVSRSSLKARLVRNLWRTTGPTTRTDLLARALDDWGLGRAELERLDAECRWIFNAANLTTGVRFGFERDVLGDYVCGLAPTRGTGTRVSRAVAASAAVPGMFAAVKLKGIDFPCRGGVPPVLVDGGAFDNTGLEALDSDRYQHVFTITINAGGVFITGRCGRVPLMGELARANSLLYRQSTALRTRWMVDRFKAWETTARSQQPAAWARQGVLFGLGSTVSSDNAPPELAAFHAAHPEHRTSEGRDLAFVPTVFDRMKRALIERLVYRGWWLTGASLARWHPDFAELAAGAAPPPVSP